MAAKTKRGPGRPKLSADERSSGRVAVRLTPAELAQLQALGDALGLSDADVMRAALDALAAGTLDKGSRVDVRVQQAELARVAELAASLSARIAQLARR